MSKKLLLIHGSVTEVTTNGLLASHERVQVLEALLRESLKVTGDGAWHKRVYEALGEPLPPIRKLKGKIPRHQQELIAAGKLKD